MKPEKKDIAIKLMRDEMTNIAKTVDVATLNDIKATMLKDADESSKENGYWLNALSMYVSRGIDTHSQYQNIVKSLTPASISKFAKDVILKGNHVEIIMLPKE